MNITTYLLSHILQDIPRDILAKRLSVLLSKEELVSLYEGVVTGISSYNEDKIIETLQKMQNNKNRTIQCIDDVALNNPCDKQEIRARYTYVVESKIGHDYDYVPAELCTLVIE